MFSRKPISAYSFLVTTVALALVSLSLGFIDNSPRELINRALDASTKLLFGSHIWKYGEYCADQRDAQTEMQDDIELEEFYNGTTLRVIANQEAKGDLRAMDQLVYKGIKARTYSNYICASSSWGYADESTFVRSQSPQNDEFECRKSVDKLYHSYKLLSKSTSTRILNGNQCKLATDGDCDQQPTDGNTKQTNSGSNHFDHWFILNTYGRVPSGPIFQTHVWPGDYAGCTQSAKWRHCFGAIRALDWPHDPNHQLSIRVGMCLPSSCDERLVRSPSYLFKLDQLLKYNLINGSLGTLNRYQLTDLHCPPALDSAHYQAFADPVSKLLGLLALIWLALVVYANVLTKLFGVSSNKWLVLIGQAFSLHLNWTQFQQSGYTDPHFRSLNAIKVLAMNWLVCTHVLMIMPSYIVDTLELRKRQDSLILSALSQGQHIVSGFFVMSGVLLAYKYFRDGTKPQRITPRVAIKMIVHRYLRLMPLYLVAYAYAKQFGHLLSRGPFWDAGVSVQSEVRQCRTESWLVPLLALANFVPPWTHCILTGWHLANDFQIFLALPIVLIVYARSRFAGRLTTVTIFILAHLHHIWLLHSSESFSWDRIAAEPLLVGTRLMADRLMYDYENPIGRAGTYFLGILVADLVYLSSSSSSSSNSPSLVKAKFILVLGLVQMILPIFGLGIVPLSTRAMFGSYSKSLSYNLIRLLGELGWSFIIYYILARNKHEVHHERNRAENLEKTEGHLVARQMQQKSTGFLSLAVWNKLVKLNYCVMLIHFSILRLLFQSQTQLMTFSGVNLIAYSITATAISYTISIFLHLLVEVPLATLVAKILIN